MKLSSPFRKEESASAPAAKPEQSATFLREQLLIVRQSLGPLADKLAAAQVDLAAAERRYDHAMQNYALGATNEPDRSDCESLIRKTDALRRITQQQERAITQLTSSLASAELDEAIMAGKERLGPLTAAAEAKLAEFAAAASGAKEAEQALFILLFSEQEGLKQSFPAILQQDANRARHSIRSQVEDIARKFSFLLNPKFETDGEVNLGVEDAQYSWRRFWAR